MKFEEDELVLSSGRRLYCHAGILGLASDGEVTYGYDGTLDQQSQLTRRERCEIAAYMTDLWLKWSAA